MSHEVTSLEKLKEVSCGLGLGGPSNPHKSSAVQSYLVPELDNPIHATQSFLKKQQHNRDSKKTFGKQSSERRRLVFHSHPFLMQILLVQFHAVEVNGKAAGIPHHHVSLVPRGVRQEGSKLQDRRDELKARFQSLPRDV